MRRFLRAAMRGVPAARFGPLAYALALCCGLTGVAHARIDEYRLDDGTGENSVGVIAEGSSIAWLNHFTIAAGAEVITSIRVAFSRAVAVNGQPVDAYLWSDPNGDGNPSDALVITSRTGTIQNSGQTQPLTQFQSFDITDVHVGPAGTSFFVGFIFDSSALGTSAGIDLTPPSHRRSWTAMSITGFVDPNNLQGSSSPGLFGLVDDVVIPGNWMVRADAVPTPGSLMTYLIGVIVLRRQRR